MPKPARNAGGESARQTPRHPIDGAAIRRDVPRRLTPLWWFWVLGEVWFTLLVAGTVAVRLWAR